MAFLRPAIRDSVLNAQATRRNRERSSHVTIEALPDEVLLQIFDFCRMASVDLPSGWQGPWPKIWQNLVHLCQRWRYVVFSSPLRLDLRIYCSDKTPARETLDVWPAFPIEIFSVNFDLGDNIIAALEHHDRVCVITIGLAYSECERLVEVMQRPFPALTSLTVGSSDSNERVATLPDTFLGGSAPSLYSLSLGTISFPTLPQLLSSCSNLSGLELRDVLDLNYEEMVTTLSTLTKLRYLCIEFELFKKIITRSPPLTRTILPALTELDFRGTYQYLEDLLAQIDTPQLEDFTIAFKQDDFFDIRQVISRSRTLGPFNHAKVVFRDSNVDIQLRSKATVPDKMLELGIIEDLPSLQVSSMAGGGPCTRTTTMFGYSYATA
ncbi:hypothetical protein BGW80DRAFT_1459739 [Lactifluus volemus]|nr:hypothetical protein BGW80DRAFT_1459739 [Lactifluus volemus]